MSNKQYRATILTEESDYQLNQELAESFKSLDITVGPKTETENTAEVVGVVDDCWYNGGIISNITIYDKYIIDMMDDDMVAVCPTLVRELGDSNSIDAMGLFVSAFPGEEVGEVESIE